MRIIGLNAYHGDSSACLVIDGKVVAAAEEERFRRIKHWAGFPKLAIEYCLGHGGLRISDIDCISVNSDPSANFMRKIGYTLRRLPSPSLLADRIRNQMSRVTIEEELARAFPDSVFKGRIDRVEHHRSHLASAFLVSPFNEAVAVSVDGFGDFSSSAWGVGHGSRLSVDGRVYFPHSLGIFYQALTQHLGFPHYGDEYKVMGLAPYGTPKFLPEMRRIVRIMPDGTFALDLKYFRHARERIDYAWSDGQPSVGTLFSPELEELLGPARKSTEPMTSRHHDLAHSTQAMYEEAFFALLDALHARYKVDALTLAGGCAMNSVANGKVRRLSQFKRVYVQAAAGDASGAIGAAMDSWFRAANSDTANSAKAAVVPKGASGRSFVMNDPYLGPSASEAELVELLSQRHSDLAENSVSMTVFDNEQELASATAGLIAKGNVIGWFQGRMEWGPRALGNRSIICDPRRADMKSILNSKIKRRESFRPFAPSILREHVSEWFAEDDDVPFMMQVFQIYPDKAPLIPAVAHVDGSGRLQTVTKQSNPLYHCLISAFRDITGVPIVLNTSFNENEPVVCKPGEALDCFLRTDMDVLCLGKFLLQRERH